MPGGAKNVLGLEFYDPGVAQSLHETASGRFVE
jgi:hypothetical protein